VHRPVPPLLELPGVDWNYEVRLTSRGDLVVDADFTTVPGALAVDDDAMPFVRDAQPSTDRRHLRYRFALREAAERLMDPETAISTGDAWVAPPSTWLMHPKVPSSGTFRFHVVAQPPARFAAGTHPAPDGDKDTYEAPASDLEDASFAAFGNLSLQTVTEGAARIEVAVAPRGLQLTPAEATAWVGRSAHAFAAYAGRFPAPRTVVIIINGSPGAPTRGETLGDGGPAVLVRARDGLDVNGTRHDWVMTHELIHVALPTLSHKHVWLSEGIPSYVEPIARVRVGLLAPETLWHDLIEGLPQGLPGPGDDGLDADHTWGRTYWGGSLFCLLADVRIRARTGNARSFDDLVRALVASGDDVESHREVARVLAEGDAVTRTDVLSALYREMALRPGTVDLPSLWKQLGVSVDGDRVIFDDTAPLASVRRGIAAR
jgi:hypothetical protein